MKNIVLILIVFFIWFSTGNGYALEWKSLHEKADRLSLQEALAEVAGKPQSAQELYVLALVYLNQHKDAQAQEIFERMLETDPESLEASWGLAEVERRQHKMQASEKRLSGIIVSEPDFPPALITLAYIKYVQKDFSEAVRLAARVLKQDRKSVDESNVVRAYLIFGGVKGVIAHFGGPISKLINGTAVLPNLKKAERLQPDAPGVLFGLGSFYLLAPRLAGGDLSKAEGYLKKTIEVDPLFTDAYVRLAQLYALKGDAEKGKSYIAKATALDSKSEFLKDYVTRACDFVCPSLSDS